MNEAAESLVHCLLEMGELSTNPVLEVTGHQTTILCEKKYPPEHLHFNGSLWRAFYHTHANNDEINHLFSNEHGHFHIFVYDEKSRNWSHLVALSMDEVGQPLRWFMVNQWVTGETWFDSIRLSETLSRIPYQHQENLSEAWLLSLLCVYQSEIKDLLIERDKIPEIKFNASQRQNRELYLLAEKNINLKNKLEQIFINKY